MGEAIAELNFLTVTSPESAKAAEFSASYLSRILWHLNQATLFIENEKDRLPVKIDLRKLNTHQENLVASLKNNPGRLGFLHGDVQPGNLLYEPNQHKVFLIDASTALRYCDSEGAATGIPAHEYNQFQSSTLLYAQEDCGLPMSETKVIQEQFIQGYHHYLARHQLPEDLGSKAAIEFFQHYRIMRLIHIYLGKIANSPSDSPDYQRAQTVLRTILIEFQPERFQ